MSYDISVNNANSVANINGQRHATNINHMQHNNNLNHHQHNQNQNQNTNNRQLQHNNHRNGFAPPNRNTTGNNPSSSSSSSSFLQQQQRFQPNHHHPPQHQMYHPIMPTAAANSVHHHGHHIHRSAFQRKGISENDFPLRMLVQSDMVGAIIGRSGSTIKQITQESEARIDVNREDSLDQQEKVITINGSPESCSIACFKIIDVIINEKFQINNKINNSLSNISEETDQASANNNNNTATNNNNDIIAKDEENSSFKRDPDIQLRILAHNNLIGRLIGRSGASIKKIMEQTSTRINISGNSLTECTQERTITVVGNLEQVRQAEKIISSKLRAAYISDVNNQLQAMSQQPYLFNNVPISYMPGPHAQNSILSTLVNSQAGHANHAMSRAIGPHQSQMNGQPFYPNSSNYLPLYPNIGGVTSTGHSLLGFNPTSSLDVEKETVHIYIPSSMVGAIIGKSGSAIKEMISSSGASIKVVAAPNITTTTTSTVTTTTTTTSTTITSSDSASNIDSTSSTMPTTEKEESSEQQEHAKKTNSVEDSNQDKDSKSSSLDECNSVQDSTECPTSDSMHDPQISTVSSLQRANSRQRNNSSESYPSTRKVTIIGTPESQWSAQYLIYRKIAIENGKSDISLMVEIQVPSRLVGKIIGKAGVTVKNIQKQTRTTIRLPDDKPNLTDNENETAANAETSVQITGEFQSTQLAQRHIRNLIKERF